LVHYAKGTFYIIKLILILNFNNFSTPIKDSFSTFPHGTLHYWCFWYI